MPEPTFRYVLSPLMTCAVETERHVAGFGWDQPPRLFALVPTAQLIAAEPALAEQLGSADPDGFTAVEQDGLPTADSLEELLGQIAWPDEVAGTAIAVERVVVPPEAEQDLPADPQAALQALATHPDRTEVRLLVAVLRDGETTTALRQRAHDDDADVALGQDIAPGLVKALRATLR